MNHHQRDSLDGVESIFLRKHHLLKVLVFVQQLLDGVDRIAKCFVLKRRLPDVQPCIQLVHVSFQQLNVAYRQSQTLVQMVTVNNEFFANCSESGYKLTFISKI